MTDRTALLVREGFETSSASAARFEADYPLALEGYDLSLRQGFCRADVTVD